MQRTCAQQGRLQFNKDMPNVARPLLAVAKAFHELGHSPFQNRKRNNVPGGSPCFSVDDSGTKPFGVLNMNTAKLQPSSNAELK